MIELLIVCGKGGCVRIGCIVLAAGKSSRFGGNKLQADLNGIPILVRTLRALPTERFDCIACVCASEVIAHLAETCGVPAKRYEGGSLSESIRTGLAEMPRVDGWMFVNGDQPLLKRDSLIRMLDAFAAHPDAVIRLSFGDVQASPSIFPASARDALTALTGESGGMRAAKALRLESIPVSAESEAELWDIDDEEARMRAIQYLNSKAPSKEA